MNELNILELGITTIEPQSRTLSLISALYLLLRTLQIFLQKCYHQTHINNMLVTLRFTTLYDISQCNLRLSVLHTLRTFKKPSQVVHLKS